MDWGLFGLEPIQIPIATFLGQHVSIILESAQMPCPIVSPTLLASCCLEFGNGAHKDTCPTVLIGDRTPPPYEMLFGAKNIRKFVNPTVLKILCDAAGVSPTEFCSLPDTAKCAIQSKLLKHFTSYLGVFELECMHPQQAVRVLHMGPSVQTYSQWRKLKHRIWYSLWVPGWHTLNGGNCVFQ